MFHVSVSLYSDQCPHCPPYSVGVFCLVVPFYLRPHDVSVVWPGWRTCGGTIGGRYDHLLSLAFRIVIVKARLACIVSLCI